MALETDSVAMRQVPLERDIKSAVKTQILTVQCQVLYQYTVCALVLVVIQPRYVRRACHSGIT